MTENLDTSNRIAAPSEADKATFVRRIRLLGLPKDDVNPLGGPRKATRLGMNEATATEFLTAPGVRGYLQRKGHEIRPVDAPEMTQDAFSPVQVEIHPPMSDEAFQKFARLSVRGVLVEGWSPAEVQAPMGGVVFSDFRNAPPDSELDSGFSTERVASSLDHLYDPQSNVLAIPEDWTGSPWEWAEENLSA